MTAFSIFRAESKYFGGGPQQTMVNFRVDGINAVLERLRAAGATIVPKREDAEYGRFAWVVDPEGNRLEPWEPLGSRRFPTPGKAAGQPRSIASRQQGRRRLT